MEKEIAAHIKVGETYKDNISGRLIVVIDDNNKPPLNKYYCEFTNGHCGCFRHERDLLPNPYSKAK